MQPGIYLESTSRVLDIPDLHRTIPEGKGDDLHASCHSAKYNDRYIAYKNKYKRREGVVRLQMTEVSAYTAKGAIADYQWTKIARNLPIGKMRDALRHSR